MLKNGSIFLVVLSKFWVFLHPLGVAVVYSDDETVCNVRIRLRKAHRLVPVMYVELGNLTYCVTKGI
jgi:hypothetical protein